MLTEIQKKGGSLCQPARDGQLRCPLIIRPTSEDVVTGNLFGTLKVLDPRWWVPDFLNRALGVKHFRPQFYRRFRIDLWVNKPPYPRELLPWDEGSTQVDAVMSWVNPATTVYIEMKYGSDLSPVTSRNKGQHGFPSDQLSRNARVGLLECGYFQRPQLFHSSQRDFVLLFVSPTRGNPLVSRFRDPVQLRQAIPHSDLIQKLPRLPFIGELSYLDIVHLLGSRRRLMNRTERILVDQLGEYLEFKAGTRPNRIPLDQAGTEPVALFPDRGESHAEATACSTSP
jgi:hypothetical protein